jgi:hypothetical protein
MIDPEVCLLLCRAFFCCVTHLTNVSGRTFAWDIVESWSFHSFQTKAVLDWSEMLHVCTGGRCIVFMLYCTSILLKQLARFSTCNKTAVLIGFCFVAVLLGLFLR